jgi:hypothetical protein
MADYDITPDKLTASFPHPILAKITGEPTREEILDLFTAVKENAASVHTTLGGGLNGHLGAVLTAAQYLVAVPVGHVAYAAPAPPGNQAAIANGATAAQIAQLNMAHHRVAKVFYGYATMQTALKNQIIAAIEQKFLRALRNRNVGFNNITVLQMITHLFTEYGQAQGTDLDANLINMQKDWNPEDPFVVIIDQIEDASDIAADAHMPFSPEQILHFAEGIVNRTNMFFDDMKEWRLRPANRRTWPLFQVFVTGKHRALKEQQRTAKAAGYHTTNFINLGNKKDDHSGGEDQFAFAADALAKLADATTSDREAMANLSTTVSTMATQLKEATELITKLKKQLDNKNNNATTTTANNNNTKKVLYYCWSHGYTTNPDHNSCKCNNPKEGHQKEATIENNMGGSQARKPK